MRSISRLFSRLDFFFQHCGKAFSEAYKLRRHLREVHDNLKDHVCSTCGKTFARADKLFQHELIHVSKSEQPVEWMPIAKQEHVRDHDSKMMSSSDTSSDSSSDDDDNVQSILDDLLETQIKEEKETKTTEVKLELPKPGSDEEDIEWEDDSEIEEEDAKFEISEDDEEGDEGIDDSDYVPQPRKSGRKRGRPRKNRSHVVDTKENTTCRSRPIEGPNSFLKENILVLSLGMQDQALEA